MRRILDNILYATLVLVVSPLVVIGMLAVIEWLIDHDVITSPFDLAAKYLY